MTGKREATRTVLGSGWTRRDVLKLAQVGGLGAAGAALAFQRQAQAGTFTGTCSLCVMHCGIKATVHDQQLTRIEGDLSSKTHGFICLHGYALREIVHDRQRLRRPLRREGESFREVSWEEALGEIAARLEQVKREHGPEALQLQTGWPFVRHPLVPLLQRFCTAFGTPNMVTVASLCEASGRMGKAITAGANFWPDVRQARTLVVWGGNPPISAPPFGRAVQAMASRSRNLIVIDPVRTPLADLAEVFLQVRPGTDGALALGMINVLFEQGWHDKRFVEEETIGAEELRQLAARYDLDRVSELTTVPKDLIVRATQLYAQHTPSCIWDGLGVEHHINGVQTIRAIAALQALTGNIDRDGGGVLHYRAGRDFFDSPLPSLYTMTTPEPVPPPPARKPLGYEEYPLYDVYNRQAQGNLFARAVLEDQPYPLRALILFGSNALVTTPNSNRVRQAFDKLSLLVCVDPFLSATGELADFVLPASTFMEGAKIGDLPLLPEQHQSWPDWKILFELARATGLGQYFPWATLEEAFSAPQKPYLPEEAHVLWPDPDLPRDKLPRFPSSSGKVELYSKLLERFGIDPLPDWKPPPEAPTDEFPFILVSGARTKSFINSQFRHIPTVSGKMPHPLASLHPSRAQELGLSQGELVDLVSPRGRATFHLQITDRVRPDTVAIPAGWPGASNANLLTDDSLLDPISGFPAMRTATCRVERHRRDPGKPA